MNTKTMAKQLNNWFADALCNEFLISKEQYKRTPILAIKPSDKQASDQNWFSLYLLATPNSNFSLDIKINNDTDLETFKGSIIATLLDMINKAKQDVVDNRASDDEIHNLVLMAFASFFVTINGLFSHFGSSEIERLGTILPATSELLNIDSDSMVQDIASLDLKLRHFLMGLIQYNEFINSNDENGMPNAIYESNIDGFSIEESNDNVMTILSNLLFGSTVIRLIFYYLSVQIVHLCKPELNIDDIFSILLNPTKDDMGSDELEIIDLLNDWFLYIEPQDIKNFSKYLDADYTKKNFGKIEW